MNYAFSSLLLLLCPIVVFTQGLIIDDVHYEKLPVQSQYNDGSKSEFKALEGVKQHSLKAYCPEVQNQGQLSTCVGWSVGYAALSMQHAIQNEWLGQKDLITKNAFSAHYIFNQIKTGDCYSGAYIDSAMLLLQNKGNLLSLTFDNNKSACDRQPSSEELRRAKSNSIVDYVALFRKDAPQRVKINKVKLSLLSNQVVVTGWLVPPSFSSEGMRGLEEWTPEIDEKGELGHAMTVVGFDDAKGAFEVMNSWGTSWGNQGFIWIAYKDFAQYCNYAFQMRIDERQKREKIYTAKFNLQRFTDLSDVGEPLFEAVALKWNKKEKRYRINRRVASIERGQVFQLLVSQVSAGAYLYAFGIEADNTLKEYFPLQQESPQITVPEVELFVPEASSGLQFNKEGTEFIILLIASKPIADYAAFLQSIKNLQVAPRQRIDRILGSAVLPLEKVNYFSRSMQIENELSGAYVIPLVLAIDVQ
ncbi:MAG: C1 family peptidase [Bacteroidota bacterium]